MDVKDRQRAQDLLANAGRRLGLAEGEKMDPRGWWHLTEAVTALGEVVELMVTPVVEIAQGQDGPALQAAITAQRTNVDALCLADQTRAALDAARNPGLGEEALVRLGDVLSALRDVEGPNAKWFELAAEDLERRQREGLL